MNTRQRKTSPLPVLIAVVLAAAVFLVPPWLPAEWRDQWQWPITIVQCLIAVALVVHLVRFVRKQRDDYWRERGNDGEP